VSLSSMLKQKRIIVALLLAVLLVIIGVGVIALQTIKMGGAKIMHGESKTFSATITETGTVSNLYPEEGSSRSVAGTLASQVAVYVETDVSWNIYDGQVIKETGLPYTVTCTITAWFTKGEYYGDEAGQPCPDMGMWFYPYFTFTPTSTPTTVQYTLTVTFSTGGTVDRPLATIFPEGSSVTVKAIPDSGYVFDGWTLNGATYHENPLTFTMNKDTSLYASFKQEIVLSPPEKPNVWSVITGIWNQIWEWLKSLFGLRTLTTNIQMSTFSIPSIQRLDMVSGGEVYPNDVFQYTFTLQNKKATTIPDSEYQDGTASFVYAVWMVTDSSGNIVQKGTTTEVSLDAGGTVSVPVTWTVPSNAKGKYAVSAVLIEIPKHWDRTSKAWVEDSATIIDKQSVELNVQSLTLPTPPTDIWGRLQQLWQGFIDWLRGIFRWG